MSDDYPDALRKGTRVEEYKIMRVLGQGGFGITYLAFDLNLNGPVALKEFFPTEYARRLPDGSVASASSETRDVFDWGLKRFLDEARAIHRLRHPNVVRAHRYFEVRGGAYIVMEYVAGNSLDKILKDRRPLTFAEWQPLLEELLAGLEHVHQHEYLHRDIKPGNVLLSARPARRCSLILARPASPPVRRPIPKCSRPEYASLEQHGKGKQTPAADLYALAVVSYRVLLGKLPPRAPDRALGATIERLEESVAGDPGWLAALDRCLALQPNDRPQSVASLREEFEEAVGFCKQPRRREISPEIH